MIDDVAVYQAMDELRAQALELPPHLPLSLWAEQNRRIKSGNLAVPYSFESVPYLKEVADSLLDPMIEKVSLLGPSRAGKTETLLHAIAYVIVRKQANILVLIPKDSLLKKFLNEKLLPMLRSTPCLAGRVGKRVEALKDRASNQTTISFIGGSLILANANTGDAYRTTDAYLIVLDEIDEGPTRR